MKCQVCGHCAPVLRRIDAPLTLKWLTVNRKLPRGAMLCVRHYAHYRGKPGAYVSAREVAA